MIHDPSLKPLLDGGTSQFLTRRQKVDRAVLYALIVVSLALGVGYVADKVATNNVASCVNRTLGQRNAPTLLEQKALTDYANGNAAAVTEIVTAKTQAEAIAGLAAFKATQDNFKAALAKVNAERAEVPLGKC